MRTWHTKKIKEIVGKLKLPKAPIGSWTYIEIGDVNVENKTITLKDKKSIKGAIIAPTNSVIVSRVRPTRGAITLIEENYVISSAFTVLKAKPLVTSSRFLFYWLGFSRNFLTYLHRKQKGSNYPSVREYDILNFEISLPPLSIQQKIVKRLDTIRKAQELNEKQISLANELFQSLLQKELDPKGKYWKMARLGSILSVLTDYHANGSYKILREHVELKSEPDYAYMVRTSDLEKNNYMDNVKYISKDAYNFLKKTKLYGGEILINKIGSAGKIYLMPHLNKPVSLGMNLFLLRIKKEVSNNLFIYYFLNTKIGTSQLLSRVTGAVTKTITKDSIRSIRTSLPPLKTQCQIVKKLSAVQEYKKKLLIQKKLLQELFEATLDKAMKGELVK